MSTFLYSTIANAERVDFDPSRDVLSIDSPDVSAADFSLALTSDGAGVRFTCLDKQFTLVGATIGTLSQSNIVFTDGSAVVNASLGNDFGGSLVGTTHDDLLIGSSTHQPIQFVATTSQGVHADGYSNYPSISADGRFVVFDSNAGNLIDQGDTNGLDDVFLKDLATGGIERVSESASGAQATDDLNGWGSFGAVVSADGRYVAFESYASNLVANDTNGWADIFLKDLQTGEVTRVSTSTNGGQANTTGTSHGVSMSADGRYVAFESGVNNLVAGDTNGASDIFVKDTQTGVLTRVSTSSTGAQGNAGLYDYGSSEAQISADGRFIVFKSYSTNLVNGDDNGAYSADVFVKNLTTGEIVCASTDSNGDFAYGEAENPSISADGRYVVFESSATLIDDGLDGWGSIYLRDMQTGTLSRVKGAGGYEYGQQPQLSGDGRFVVFTTMSALVGDDTNDVEDVYVKDLQTGEFALVSRTEDGGLANGRSLMANISLDGSTIVFRNDGSNLVDGANGTSASFVVGNPLYTRTLQGGAGNDSYLIASDTDVVVEQANQGNDVVRASVSYALTANVERLVLTGLDAIDGTGNALANRITGNDAANAIDGGAGADAMAGGGGDDLYTVDDSGDTITEATGGGTDGVRSSVSLVLSGEVENLTLVGSGNLNGTGNASANRISGTAGNNVLNGGAGADTVSYATATAGVTVNLSLNTAQATGGAGTDTLISFENIVGSAYGDRLTGTVGANTIDGGAGRDTMTGGAGNDSYVVDATGDQIIESSDGGLDTVRASASFTLAANIENLTLTGTSALSGTGNALANVLTGNAGANALAGDAGNDTLEGGGGKDTLTGGSGNDTYIVDSAFDQAVESVGGGTDNVQSSVSYTLQSEVEDLVLTGTSAINGTGNSKINHITGNAAANVLDGGSAADVLTGGEGNDTYVVDNSNDQTIELAAGGIDLVKANVSWTLGAELENLTLTGNAAVNATGNAKINIIIGNAGANILNGGAGGDSLTGGAGDDTYIVDSAGDHVVEQAGGGIDIVKSSVSFTLGDEVENLTLLGTTAINATGNLMSNVLTGNSGANVLNGGFGQDTMIGGAGDDTYHFDDAGDVLVEAAGGGTDTVLSYFDFALADNFENLTLVGWSAANAYGNAKANVITGNEWSNRLDGGLGADTMRGGDGSDTYVVNTAGDIVIEDHDDIWSGYDTVESSVTWALSANVEALRLTGSANANATGNTAGNVIEGNAGNNVVDGGRGGVDTLAGGAGSDTFVMHDLEGDFVRTFERGLDKFKIDQSDLRIGNGDTVVDGAISIVGPNGFSTSAELVVVIPNIVGSIDESSAAAYIGRANSAYAVNDQRLFVVDNGVDSAVYLFRSANADAVVSADELTLVATLQNTAWTDIGDYIFGA